MIVQELGVPLSQVTLQDCMDMYFLTTVLMLTVEKYLSLFIKMAGKKI